MRFKYFKETIGFVLLVFLLLPIFYHFGSPKTQNTALSHPSFSTHKTLNNNQTNISTKSSNSSLVVPRINIENATLYSNRSTIYIIYSPTCPHCRHLLSYLKTVNTSVQIVETTDSVKMSECLRKFGVSWDFGVPLLVAFTKNKTYVMEGYPASFQDKNGYFMGKSYEEGLCKSINGTPVYINNTYAFCIQPNGKILGNKYAVNYILSICEKEKCYAVCPIK